MTDPIRCRSDGCSGLGRNQDQALDATTESFRKPFLLTAMGCLKLSPDVAVTKQTTGTPRWYEREPHRPCADCRQLPLPIPFDPTNTDSAPLGPNTCYQLTPGFAVATFRLRQLARAFTRMVGEPTLMALCCVGRMY